MRTCLKIIAVLLFGIIQGCCKEECIQEYMQVGFIGFEREDIDTIIWRKFEPPAHQVLLDTQTVFLSAGPADTTYYPLTDSDGFEVNKNYEIWLPGINRTYQLSDLKNKRVDCSCGQRDARHVSGYVLDNQFFSQDVVYLIK